MNIVNNQENLKKTKRLTSKGFIKWLLVFFVLANVLGLIGIVLALVYPLFWLLFPTKIPCVYCYIYKFTHNNEICNVCLRQTPYTTSQSLKSAIINAITILILSIFSIFIVIGEGFIYNKYILELFNPSGVVEISQIGSSYKVGDEMYFNIELKNIKQSINLVNTEIYFSNNVIQVESIDVSESFATIFIKKTASNTDGKLEILGGFPNPGFIGDKTLFVKIKIKAVAPGNAKIEFTNNSKVYANAGEGTNILYNFLNANFVVLP